jgi:hypothetical protein
MFKLASSVDHARLRQACQSIVTSFDIFRTTFHYIVDLGKWAQVSHSDAPMTWIEVPLHAGESLDAMIQTVTGLTSVSEQGSFTPSMAFCLVEQQDDAGIKNYSFAIAMHHAMYDGISIGTLLEELERAYLLFHYPARSLHSLHQSSVLAD